VKEEKPESIEARELMARYFARSCPKCNGYLGIVLPDKGKLVVQAINDRCVEMRLRTGVAVISRETAYPLLLP
jgi:ssDNA-binding Zn-finger/Zn-ribbon topoisomerase 1